jgi:hypothetical protein
VTPQPKKAPSKAKAATSKVASKTATKAASKTASKSTAKTATKAASKKTATKAASKKTATKAASKKTATKAAPKTKATIKASVTKVASNAPGNSAARSGDQNSQLKVLIAKGKEQGYLTYAEVNDHLPNDIVDPEQIEDIVNMINDMGITVYEKAPEADSLVLSDAAVTGDDEQEEAAEAIATVDSEFGRTTDPVRMYMREMGTVELLTREGEIRIAKRIE